MSLRSDWPCWEIMQCKPEHAAQCPAYQSSRPCWEVMQELDVFSFNICKDCLVYVIKQKNPIFSKEEILSIMCQKGVDVTGRCCVADCHSVR
ncbi:hypothetical protein GF1_13880 [Desulfolithobacter dissulfuricans]|uniref:Uncharacterized protein n=2 Tax=Desulfolithobacter dissulfuricans TaxID=2795293 RepID=A0A915XJS1_9BACT|nr:hypothetical protein GF1_13880 [Desulfolithobacter dissulfuricans]